MPYRFRIGNQIINFDNFAPGADELDELIDVDVETAISGNVLAYDGYEWIPFDASIISGPTGPAGPSGPTGPAGTTGATGAQGLPGDTYFTSPSSNMLLTTGSLRIQKSLIVTSSIGGEGYSRDDVLNTENLISLPSVPVVLNSTMTQLNASLTTPIITGNATVFQNVFGAGRSITGTVTVPASLVNPYGALTIYDGIGTGGTVLQSYVLTTNPSVSLVYGISFTSSINQTFTVAFTVISPVNGPIVPSLTFAGFIDSDVLYGKALAIGGELVASRSIDVKNNLFVSGNTHIGNLSSDRLFVTASSYFAEPITINSNKITGSAGGNITLQSGGSVVIAGDLQVDGNDIKSSNGSTAITLSSTSATVTMPGNLILSGSTFVGNASSDRLFVTASSYFEEPITINSNKITGSAGGNITLQSGGSVVIAGDLQIDGNDIKSSNGSTAITLSSTSATVTIPGNLILSGSTFIGNTSGDRLFVTASSYMGQTLNLEKAGSTTLGASQLYLNGATSNRIDWAQGGVAAPTLTTRSAGTKLVLYPEISATTVDYGLGVESLHMWFSIPDNLATQGYKWYGADAEIMRLYGHGTLQLGNNLRIGGNNIEDSGGTTRITLNSNASAFKANSATLGGTYTLLGLDAIPLKIKQSGDGSDGGAIFIRSGGSTVNWRLFVNAGNDFIFNYQGTDLGFLADPSHVPAGTNVKLNFTGQHKVKPNSYNFFSNSRIGLIVASTGRYDNTDIVEDERDNITINEALPIVELTTLRKQKSVIGVISDKEDENSTVRTYQVGIFGTFENKKADDDHRLAINALGEGAVWICNINGDLENGDYITTCEIPGYGMKQDEYFLCNFTVAKITCDCDFDLNSTVYRCEEFEWNGQTYRKAFVGCTYHCG